MNRVQWYSYAYIIEKQSITELILKREGGKLLLRQVIDKSEPIKICKVQKSRGKIKLKAVILFFLQ